jgi:hypothetical protein
MSTFKPGDRVVIVNPDHPWAAHAGVISRAFDGGASHGLDWVVRLDDGTEAGVAEADLLPRRHGDPA